VTNRISALTNEQFIEELVPDHSLAFSDIPAELLGDEVIIRWLRGSIELATERYAQIPQSYRSERVLLYAGSEGVPVLRHTKPSQVENYYWLVITCVNHDYTALADVDPSYQNDRLIQAMFMWRTAGDQIVLLREIEWMVDKISKDLLINYSLKDVNFLLDLPPKIFPENADEYFQLELPETLAMLRARGRLDLLAAKISRGGWHENGNPFLQFHKPESLQMAIEHLVNAPPGQYIETLYLGCVMTYPIEQVVPGMKGNRLKALLLEVYSPEALKPFLRVDADLRGAMLEGALGL
jgi:hypothetical protein